MQIQIYTDGAAKGNPGPGGYGAILMSEKGHYRELSQGYRRTTNNRMELMAVIAALEALKNPCDDITIFSDSKYVVDSIEKKWLQNWVRKGFAKTKNPDLWKRYIKAAAPHLVKFTWIKGHAGHQYNERCDQLAVQASAQVNLPADFGYEQQTESLL
jgi:ribonuclease HI